MVGPSSQISKFLVTLLIILLVYYAYMDFNLYVRIKNYPINRSAENDNSSIVQYHDVTWVKCEINPLCEITVKAVLLDHTNFYLFAPLVQIIDNFLNISQISFITPNAISFFHVFVAILSGKCVSSGNLAYRRLGVVLFELRTWLDDLDGHVARVRKHIKGERSEVGTSGYYIDGICDALGCVALVVGLLIFLRNNPPRRGYMQLPTTAEAKDNTYCGKVSTNKIFKKLSFFSLQLTISSAAWNRYIALYQDLLEREQVTPIEFTRQNDILTSFLFYSISWLWRVINVHNMLHCLLLALFCDKLWEFLCFLQHLGFGILFSVICMTEVHFINAKNFVFNRLTDPNDDGMI